MLSEAHLTYSSSVYASSDEIEDRHEPHAIKAHTLALRLPAVEDNAEDDEDDGR